MPLRESRQPLNRLLLPRAQQMPQSGVNLDDSVSWRVALALAAFIILTSAAESGMHWIQVGASLHPSARHRVPCFLALALLTHSCFIYNLIPFV